MLEQANKELAKLNKIADYEGARFDEEDKQQDNRSMFQVMQDKRQAAEQRNADLIAKQPAVPTGETMEERAQRLKAQRDLLRQMKEEKRQKELDDFNNHMDSAT